MTTASPIELRKIAYRQSAKDGLVITFACHPHDMPDALATAAIGSRFMAALVEIGDDEQPVNHRPHPLVQRAAILCRDDEFQSFVSAEFPMDWTTTTGTDDEKTAAIMRGQCMVSSRKELATNRDAAERFDLLTGKFEMWKRQAERIL